jgi:hypothetical protein
MKGLRRLGHESLESRCVMAAFGVPWHDPGHLSISFAPDGTTIAGHESSLFAALDAQQPTEEWQRTILTAFQSWAEHSNLNFGWRDDGGQVFGSAGFAQGDPRFGDIRIGAQAMRPEALAIAVPPDATLSSTFSGDVLLNSDYVFGSDAYSLLAVMLHEAGHSLGLANSLTLNAVMYSEYSQTRTTLSSEDITRIQSLYGKRAADIYEGSLGNNTRGRASSFGLPADYKGETPLIAFGDITTRSDVDFFTFRAPDDGNDDVFDRDVTIRLQTEGSSLLAPKVTIFDQHGRTLATQSSTSLTGDTLQIRLTGTSSRQKYFVKVEGAKPTSWSRPLRAISPVREDSDARLRHRPASERAVRDAGPRRDRCLFPLQRRSAPQSRGRDQRLGRRRVQAQRQSRLCSRHAIRSSREPEQEGRFRLLSPHRPLGRVARAHGQRVDRGPRRLCAEGERRR